MNLVCFNQKFKIKITGLGHGDSLIREIRRKYGMVQPLICP
jgi:hypothetical protein